MRNVPAVTRQKADGTEYSFQPTYVARLHGGSQRELIARTAFDFSGLGHLYLTLNPVRDTRRCVFGPVAGRREAANEEDVLDRRWLWLDIDRRKTPADKYLSATDAERERVRDLAGQVRDYLAAEGFPAPTVVDSGNGLYLMYRLAGLTPVAPVPPDDPVCRILHHLNEKYESHGGAEVDPTGYNLSRIYRLVGTLNMKGEPSEDRPHRYARLLEAPADRTPVPAGLLADLASRALGAKRVVTVTEQPAGREAKRPVSTRGSGSATDTHATHGTPTPPPGGGAYTRLTPRFEARAAAVLDTIPPAVEGQGGSKVTLWAARCLVRGFRFHPSDAETLLHRYYNPRCSPPWSAAEISHKVAEAATKPFGKPDGWLLADRPAGATGGGKGDFPRGYDDITPEEAAKLADECRASQEAEGTKWEACPYAAHDAVVEILGGVCRDCGARVGVVNRDNRTGARYVSSFRCDSGVRCVPCRNDRIYRRAASGLGYVLATSADPPPAERRVLAIAITTEGPGDAMRKRLNRAGAEFYWMETNDPLGCVELAAENAAPGADVTFRPLREYVGARCDTATSFFLWAASLAPGEAVPTGFVVVTAAGLIRAMGNAYRTAPPPRDGEIRYKRFDHSKDWHCEEPEEVRVVTVEGRVTYDDGEAREILDRNGICQVTHRNRGGDARPSYAIDAPPAVSAAASMVLRGVGTKELFAKPDKDRATVVLGEWRAFLQGADLAGIGDGDAVQALLVRELWAGPAGRYDELVPRFLRADRHDRDVAEVAKEMDPHTRAAIDGVINSDWVLALVREAHELFEAGRRDAAAATKMRRTVVYEVRKRLEGCADFVVAPLVPRILARLADQIRRVFKTCPKATPPGTKNTTKPRAGETESQTVA